MPNTCSSNTITCSWYPLRIRFFPLRIRVFPLLVRVPIFSRSQKLFLWVNTCSRKIYICYPIIAYDIKWSIGLYAQWEGLLPPRRHHKGYRVHHFCYYMYCMLLLNTCCCLNLIHTQDKNCYTKIKNVHFFYKNVQFLVDPVKLGGETRRSRWWPYL